MSLHQPPESPSGKRMTLVPKSLLLALTLALAACDKQPIAAPEALPVKIPTGAIADTLTNTTPDLRQEFAKRVVDGTLGATGGDFYTRGFTRDAGQPSAWHVAQLDVGFGPQRGTHVVTYKQEKGKTFRNEMLDRDNDGTVDEVEEAVSWPIKKDDTSLPMSHSEKRYGVSPATNDHYASALHQALVVLEAEKEKQK